MTLIRTTIAAVFLALSLGNFAAAQTPDPEATYIPPRGLVPDEATAVTIARAVLIPIYGADLIKSEEPLTAQRHGDIWVVVGTLGAEKFLGGTAELKLSAKDGRILNVTHYQ